jgi:hypothetical protein
MKFSPPISQACAENSSGDSNPMVRSRVFQIVYDERTRQSRDPGFDALDNEGCPEPDWYEYYPIRQFLINELDEDTLYGFFSPNFHAKTGLNSSDVFSFVEKSLGADVCLFSPFPCHSASFLNVFEHQDFFFKGLLYNASNFFYQFDQKVDLWNIINDSTNTVFCNFFLAKPRFWREWLTICEILYEQTRYLGHALNSKCLYEKENNEKKLVPLKVFVMECVASYLLARSSEFACFAYPFAAMPYTGRFVGLKTDVVLLDDLKRIYARSLMPADLVRYRQEQIRVLKAAWPERQ